MKVKLTLLKLMDEARKDPKVQKAERRKESALKVKETYGGRHERPRNQNRREHIPMSQDQLDRIYYGDNYGSSS